MDTTWVSDDDMPQTGNTRNGASTGNRSYTTHWQHTKWGINGEHDHILHTGITRNGASMENRSYTPHWQHTK